MVDKDTLRSSIARVLKKNSIESTLILARQDGVVVFEQDQEISEKDKQTLGALMAGAWQAAEAMANFFPVEEKNYFRLGFDTSDSGIYILPINASTEKFYLGLFFKNEINPAILKNKLRNVSQQIIEELSIYFDARENMEEPLFENITDDEIEKIFSFAGV
ncbi:MAG: hypothetical protein CME70_07225 [Halobacteriovorax sp.]|nr:hypothetical protein [Halobacteriovorax sp.]|tara:strand:+ start:395573 stop:396055 length:483 start_codon:yes stop_codon:yes gene_type:complete